MTANLHLLPASQLAVNGGLGFLDFLGQVLNGIAHVELALCMGLFSLYQLGVHLGNFFFEIKPVRVHGESMLYFPDWLPVVKGGLG